MPVQPAMFALMGRYGRTPTSAPVEFKTLVKALHSRGMECLLGTFSFIQLAKGEGIIMCETLTGRLC